MNLKHTNLVLCAALTSCLVGVSGQPYPCTGPVHELTDVGRRGPSYVVDSPTEPIISDSTLPTGWYVAKNNERYYTMVNGTAPSFARCGTYNPIYLKDKITTVEENGKEYIYIACLVDYDCNCKLRYDVKIRKCGQEIQYFLRPTDGISSYCFEQPTDTVMDPAPNYRIQGPINVSVALMYINTKKLPEPELDFKCNLGSADNSYFYEVNWVINGNVEKTFQRVKVGEIESTNLNETTLRIKGFSLGISIQCGVRTSSSVTGHQTNLQMSDIFYAGVKIENPWLSLESGSSAIITLQPTVPLGCRRRPGLPSKQEDDCSVNFEMFDPNTLYTCGKSQVVFLSNQKLCGSSMDGWRRNKEEQECMNQHNVSMCSYSRIKSILKQHKINVIVANDRDTYVKEDKTFKLQLKTGANSPHTFWENARLSDVQILYRGNSSNLEWREKYCWVVNDPTLHTFDGSVKYMRQFGTYLLYNHTKFGTEVQIKTQRCNEGSNASCTCAAAIKAGGDVFKIIVCTEQKVAEFSHCRTNHLNVSEINSKEYEIYFPTGTKVRVIIRETFLQVFVHPSPVDVRSTEGLCGNLDGKNEILTDSFFSKWRIQGRSLFDSSIDFSSTLILEHNVCICPRVSASSTVSLSGKDPRAECFTQEYAVCNESIVLQDENDKCFTRTKRSVERHQKNRNRLFKILQLKERPTHRNRKSTTDAPLSETDAYRECISLFQSKSVYNMRNELPGMSLNDSLSACVNDMMIDGQKFWKDESYNSWVTIISEELKRNRTYSQANEKVVWNFMNVSCPAQCNGNGDCINGKCVCRNEFVGDSCFVKKSTPLELTDIEGGGECDLAYGDDCHECLQFHTVNLIRGFSCKINTQELDENGTIIMSDEIKRTGEYKSIFEGYCCPSAVEERRRRSVTTSAFTVRYTISVSNDGVNFGPGRDIYVYDSTCQTYVMMQNGDWKFRIKDDTCYIDGGCYRHGNKNIMIQNVICCPYQAKYAWSTAQDCDGPEDLAENDTITIITVAVLVSGILIIVLAAVLILRAYKGRKRPVSSKESEPVQQPVYTDLNFERQPETQFHQQSPNVTDYEQLKI